LRIRCFDPIAKASELPDHSGSALLLGLFGEGWAAFFVTDSLVQDQPDQPTLSMSNGPDGLIMSQARDRAAIHNLEDASFGSGCGVGRLVENAPHVAVAGRRSVAVVHARALDRRQGRHPPGRRGISRRDGGTDFGDDLLRRVHSQTGHFRQPLYCILVLIEQTGHLLVQLADLLLKTQ